MALPRTPAYVRADAEQWSVVERDTDVALSSHPTLVAALTALLDLEYFAGIGRGPTFCDADSGECNGVYRWLDASAEEDDSPDGKTQVTGDGIRTMAARLCEGDPIMIDGGSADSGAHASAEDTAALANGWAYVGVDFVDPDGRVHLALYAELLPDIAKAFDTGRLARGSIFFGHAKDNPGDALLLSHALTNIPAVQGLTPSTGMKTHPRATKAFFVGARTRRPQMPGKNTPPVKGQRASAVEKLNELRAQFSVPAEMTEDWQVACYVGDVMRALMQAAKLDILLNGGADGAPAPIAAQAGETREAHLERITTAARDAIAAANPPPAAGTKAEVSDADVAFLSDVKAALTAIFGEGDPAALLEKLKASQEAIKGAIGAGGTTPPNPEGTMSTDAKEIRTELAAVRTTLTSVQGEMSEIKAERDALKAEKKKLDATAKVDARAVAVKRTLTKEDREWTIDMVLAAKDEKAADELLKRVIGPVTGEAMPSTIAGSRSTPTPPPGAPTPGAGTGDDGDPRAQLRALVAVEEEAIRKEKPNLKAARVTALAQQKVFKSNPDLLRGAGSAGEE